MPNDITDPDALDLLTAARKETDRLRRALDDTGRQLTTAAMQRDAHARRVAELEATLARRVPTSADTVDITPGQVAAYLKAARAAGAAGTDAVVRAGLAAVQWAILNPAAEATDPVDRIGEHFCVEGWVEGDDSQDDYCGFCSQPGGQIRYVEWPCDAVIRSVAGRALYDAERVAPEATPVDPGDLRVGDTVTRVGTVGHLFEGGFTVDWEPGIWENIDADAAGFAFTRPAGEPLPTTPGILVEATTPGGARAQFVLTADEGDPWFMIVPQGVRRWYNAAELTDHKVISTPGDDR